MKERKMQTKWRITADVKYSEDWIVYADTEEEAKDLVEQRIRDFAYTPDAKEFDPCRTIQDLDVWDGENVS